ncbi:MAG: hypothetical protein FJZ97_09470 [Chloroflexi bacterium]|nr:hypothetical protein [Chloroflexota bacterium]
MPQRRLGLLVALLLTASLSCALPGALPGGQDDQGEEATVVEEPEAQEAGSEALPGAGPAPEGTPGEGLKLVFIHHSSGENWLADENGGLGLALMQHGYFVSDTNYDWGPAVADLGPIGSFTDTGHWWTWFQGPESDEILQAVFNESEQHAGYTRLPADPGGENVIVMFKSCFPNSALEGAPDDPPTTGENPLRGLDPWSGAHTVANAKGIYADLLEVFAAHPDKLFIAVTAPPLHEDETSPEQAANARAFNRWLVEEWLADYPLANVAVFDFYNVLTSNAGSPDEHDGGSEAGNHHRLVDGEVEYITDQGSDTSAYAYPGDSHPTASGNQKASEGFVPLLDYLVQRWLGG